MARVVPCAFFIPLLLSGNTVKLNIAAAEKEWLPTLENNTYIQHRGASAGAWGSEGVTYLFDDTVEKSLEQIFGEKQAEIVYVEE